MKKFYKCVCIAISILFIVFLAKSPVTIYADSASDEPKTSYAYKLFATEEEYEAELKTKMGRVYECLHEHIRQDNLCPIPGIIETVYHDKGSLMDSVNYVPQGICKTDDYILVSAYHNRKGLTGPEGEANWRGIVYVIDRFTHEYLANMALPQSYHNGGIAFDGNRVWFCGNTSDDYLKDGDPFVQCMDYSRFKEMVNCIMAGGVCKDACIEAEDFSEKITINNKSSFLECNDGFLWVGTYVNNNPDDNVGYAIGYPIIEEDGKTKLDKLRVKRINGMPSSAQGMDIEGGDLYVSSSGHGNENDLASSFVSRFDVSSLMGGNNLIDLQGESIKRIEVPKMNEEILVDEDVIYIIFEAAGEPWLKGMKNGMKTDRILPVDKALWNS